MDLTGWLEYFAGGLATQLEEVKARGEEAIRLDVFARKHGLSDRQALDLGDVLEHGGLTIREFEALCPQVNRRTLQRDLKAMVDKACWLNMVRDRRTRRGTTGWQRPSSGQDKNEAVTSCDTEL